MARRARASAIRSQDYSYHLRLVACMKPRPEVVGVETRVVAARALPAIGPWGPYHSDQRSREACEQISMVAHYGRARGVTTTASP